MFWQEYLPGAIFFSFGPLIIHWYGLILVTAIIVAVWQSKKYFVKKAILTSNQFDDLVFYIIIFGLLGARFGHVVFFNFPYYSQNPGDILKVWQGGLAIQGALLFGILTVFIWARHYKVTFLKLTDGLVFAVPLGQAIGRWGNYFNQELFGKPTRSLLGIPIAPINRVNGYENFTHFHPIFFYESFLSLLLFFVLYKIAFKNTLKRGTLTLLYFAGYGLVRLLVEFVRIDETFMVFGARMGQIISVLFILVALSLIYFIYKKPLPKYEK